MHDSPAARPPGLSPVQREIVGQLYRQGIRPYGRFLYLSDGLTIHGPDVTLLGQRRHPRRRVYLYVEYQPGADLYLVELTVIDPRTNAMQTVKLSEIYWDELPDLVARARAGEFSRPA